MDEAEPLKFSNEVKIRRQMHRRGWTEQQLREALEAEPLAARGRRGPALRFIHPATGKAVILDAVTREIFHVGGEGFRYDD